jgi:hypothetical protein
MTKQQKIHAKDEGTIDEGNIASISKSELEALPPEENPTETDYKVGKDGKRRRNAEDLTGSANRCSPKLPKQENDATWMKTIPTST